MELFRLTFQCELHRLLLPFNAFDGVMCPRSLPGRRGFTGAEEGAGGRTDGAAEMLPQTSPSRLLKL